VFWSTSLPSDGKVVAAQRGDAVARRSMATTKVRPEGCSTSPAPADRLLNVNEAAAMLAVKPATLYQWAYQRRIRPALNTEAHRGLDPG
jgi:hypothetical protein